MMERSRIIHLLSSVFGVVWLFVVTIDYYIVHKRFTVANAMAFGSDSDSFVVDRPGDVRV